MPCEQFENLKREWEEKFRAEVSAHDGYKGSMKKVTEIRNRTTRERINAENGLVRHTENCPICKSEGRKPWGVDEHQPFH